MSRSPPPAARAFEEERPRYRILAIDGGGIYGLMSAVWLRQLAERDAEFLDQRGPCKIDLFAGVSSGALNALLLASAEDPRAFVLSGALERFWTEEREIFSNNNPVQSALSLLGLSGWSGEQDFLRVLHRHFGDRTLEDLPWRALAATFNWSGDDVIEFAGKSPFVLPTTPFKTPPNPKFPPPDLQRPGVERRRWKPRLFTNYPSDPDRLYAAVDVGYAAAAPPGLRKIRGGLGDAATYTGNPAVEAVAIFVEFMRYDDDQRALGRPPAAGEPSTAGKPGEYLDQIALLSVGAGGTTPFYWLRDFNFGFSQLLSLPANPFTGVLFPPLIQVPLEAPAEDADLATNRLLGLRYFRLDPALLEVPVAFASMSARFEIWRRHWIDTIYQASGSPRSLHAVDRAIEFTRNGWIIRLSAA